MQTGYEVRCILGKSMWKLRIKILSCARMIAWTFELRVIPQDRLLIYIHIHIDIDVGDSGRPWGVRA